MTAGREEALRLDAYLESDVAGRPWPVPDVHALDPELRRAVDALRSGTVRVHPSFRFVEALATRLRREAEALLADGVAPLGAGRGDVVPFPLSGEVAPATRHHRTVLVRGAISGVSLAGVAFVAWRLGRLSGPSRRSGPLGMPFGPGGRA